MIYTYDPQIYPRKIFVVIKESNDSIRTHFQLQDGDDITEDDLNDENTAAHVFDVMEATGENYLGIMIRIQDLNITTGVIAHEAVHAAWDICHDSGISLDWDNQEPFTYLVGWIADKIKESMEKFKE